MGDVRVLGMVALLGLCARATVAVRKIGADAEPTGPSGIPTGVIADSFLDKPAPPGPVS